MNLSIGTTGHVLIAAITPYFLERDVFWFEENFEKILEARKTQSFFLNNILFLKKDQKYNLSQFLRTLDEMGYEKVYKIQELGEFSHRGNIVEVSPSNLNFTVRFEFLGNQITEIEKIPFEIKDSAREALKKKLKSQKLFSDLKGLKSGDYLVHLDHGIGIYNHQSEINDQQYYELNYAEGDKLYVPVGLERKLSRYIGFTVPKISRLGSPLWLKAKKRIREETEKLARELLEIYAKREIASRPPYILDTEIEKILAQTFNYEETPDQSMVIGEIKKDLQAEEPMDRIVLGDVGFGKTEIALRTMVQAISNNYQAAIICPTTILANQHFQNFRKRLENLPIKVGLISRLQTKKEQKKIADKLKDGTIDIIVGTHRLLSKDIEFKKLGLLIIDDEHRFGVKQKEKLRKQRASLDILSLSATPIPRTLYLTLSSLKKMSVIKTAPLGRLPIKTAIFKFKKELIKETVEKEIARNGQVYFLFNRVRNIEEMREFLKKLLPGIKIGIAHGRLSEKELTQIMEDFKKKDINVLVTTTIIENGIDLPNVNTLIVADSTKLGLSQAYQIRGRIGRSSQQAFAYFLYPKKLSALAKERLKALKEAEALGSGYQIALKDLEIRGAGNILGKEQSGNINQVGLNLYCQMLSEAVEKIKEGPQTS